MFMKKKKFSFCAFSVMELVVSFVIIALVTSASTPILFKKSSKMKLKSLNSITTKCDTKNSVCSSFLDNPNDENSSRCQVFKKRVEQGQILYTCALCKTSAINACKIQGTYFDTDNCKCFSCDKFNTTSCQNCCTRCNRDFCTGCALGVGLKTRTAKMGCVECEAGTYSDTDKDESCKECKKGYYQNETRKSSCKLCDKGHYCDETGLKDQKPCKQGFYQDKTGQFSCESCPLGHKCPNKAMETPSTCGYGFYQDQTGQISCKDCNGILPGSTTKTLTATKSAQCVCPDGQYKVKTAAGSLVCAKCAATTFKRLVAGTTDVYECPKCTSGSYCPGDGNKYQCACGTYSLDNSASCTEAPAGYYTPITDGLYKSITKCTGVTVSSKGSCNCSTCPFGTYVDSNHTKCLSCKTTYGTNCKFCNETGCTQCEAGFGQSAESSKTSNACYCKLVSESQKKWCENNSSFYVKTDDIEGLIGCSGLCVKTVNAGDSGGITIPSSVNVIDKDSTASTKELVGTKPYCWKGQTAANWNACYVGNYKPGHRTVCNYWAAREICTQSGWRLATKEELLYFNSNFATVEELNPCYNLEENSCKYAFCACGPGCYGSAASIADDPDGRLGLYGNMCHPHGLWGEAQFSYITELASKSSFVVWRDPRFAFSVRCVLGIKGE